VENWLLEWDVALEEKSEFLKTVADAYAKYGQMDTSYKYTLSWVRSIPTSSPSARSAAIQAIQTALCLPSVFDFDPLFKLEAVLAVKDHELFNLLQIFLSDGLAEFNSWEAAHSDTLGKHDLDRSQLERKIRLLTLASLAFKHVGSDLPYSRIASVLQVEISEVENWVIDVIRSGLVSGKLSQTSQTLHITRSTARTFELEQWAALEKILVAWKSGLAEVLDVVAAARKKTTTEVVQLGSQTQPATVGV
jgi:translation initiation factor 3 subunit M